MPVFQQLLLKAEWDYVRIENMFLAMIEP